MILKCKCGHESNELEKFKSHKAYCTFGKEGQGITVGDLLTMDLSETAIPSSVEKATLKILEYKISDSQDGTAKFASGGPRVRFSKLCDFYNKFLTNVI